MRWIKFKGRLFFWLLIIFLQPATNGQELYPKFRVYNSAEGLSQSVVLSIFQDSKNFLWFGTEDGLNKFDGYNFRIYRFDPEDSSSISDNWIQHIHLEDKDGDIWMETADRAINIFNPRTDQFRKLIPSEKNSLGLLPFREIFFIKQDENNNIWISTDRGLFSVDKKSWKVNQAFVNQSRDTIRAFLHMTVDKSRNVWFGSNKGLLIWNSDKKTVADSPVNDQLAGKPIYGILDIKNNIWVITKGEIIGYKSAENYYKIFSYDNLLAGEIGKTGNKRFKRQFASVHKDSRNNIWICSQRGLVNFDTEQENVRIFLNKENDKSSLSSNEVTSFYEDKKGNIWIGTRNGLNKYLADKKAFLRVSNASSGAFSFIAEIYEDKTGRIWAQDQMINEFAHVFYLDEKKNDLVQVKRKDHDPEGMPVDFLYSPFIDHHGNIWYGTYGSGVLQYAPFQKKFDLIRQIPGNSNSIAGNSSWAISGDAKGRLWFALFQDGLDCYDPATGMVEHYGDKIKAFTGAKNINVISVVCDRENRVWVGIMGQGIVCIDIVTGKMKLYHNGQPENKITSNFILALTLDYAGNLLISYRSAGFDVMNLKSGQVTNYSHSENSNSLYNNNVRYTIGTSDGNYWISCDGAITLFNRSQNTMTHFESRKKGGKGILADKASVIFEDSKGRIWVGTHGGGLSLFDKQNQEFRYWTEKDGLINNVIYGILEDKSQNLWISTNMGLSCFNPVTYNFTNYYANDGLQGSEFNANSFFKDKSGKMYFGGINGITSFYPEEIQADPIPPQIIVTGFQIFNKKVEVLPFNKNGLEKGKANRIIEDKGHMYLPENISYTRKLTLDYDYKVITFEYAALRFDMPERCTFMYKMEGFEEEWNLAGDRRFATYTNLPPGKYIFKVTAANADGIWNPEPAKIEIEIKPPFYLTWWFISFGIASLIVASTSYVMKREKNLKRTKGMLEEKVKLRTHELNEKNEELMLRNIQILKQKEEIATQAKRLRDELNIQNQTSEQALLRSQINPHFLFNTLNNIYSLVYQKSTSAPEALMKLSEIMRYMLYDTSADMVQLDKEVQYLNSFIDLQMLRLKNKDFVKFEISGDPLGKQIAPMLLIAFVENAFKHGNKNAPAPGIRISLDCTRKEIRFSVKNKKNVSASKDTLGGIGLINVKRRLELIYHDKYKLDITNLDDKFEIDLIIKQQ